jgi:hypothetical protein
MASTNEAITEQTFEQTFLAKEDAGNENAREELELEIEWR